MILIATAETSEHAFQQAVVFADQIHAAGYEPVLSANSLAPDTRSATRFHALPYLREDDEINPTHLIVIGAEANDPENLDRIRRMNLGEDTKIIGIGSFETPQDQISATARLTYLTGRAPIMKALNDFPRIQAGNSICPSFGINIETETFPHLRGKPSVSIIVHDMEDPNSSGGLQFLTTTRKFNALAYMSGKDKSDWIRLFGPGGHIYGFSEISPTALSKMSDVLVLTGPIGNNQNALCLLNNHLVSGGAVVDASPDGEFERAGLPVHRGPTDLAYLQMFLDETILPNLDGIKEATKTTSGSSEIGIEQILEDLPMQADKKSTSPAKASQVHFMPTNGIGLGHAQRCVLVAEELSKQSVDPSFFAFPSCLPMINRAGFAGTPLIQRSELHEDSAANDLANYARLRSRMNEGDVFVFDGGYIFDSVTRSILDRKLSSVWIRRGLWRAGQDNRIPLDREKFFARIIAPQEAMNDLNGNLSNGTHIHAVGPIVRKVASTKKSRNELHKAIKKEFGVEFDKLIITMLGSGAVHDLSANVQAICNTIESREDCLNLMVVWPSSVVPSQRYAWNRSKVVKTMQASWLAAHSDFIVSAAGYNSFHETLYNKIPAIFVPQEAQILDDQEARAEAAAKLGLAAHIPAAKLSQLDREVRRFLDQGKAETIKDALEAYDLPETGNKKAADLIKEMIA